LGFYELIFHYLSFTGGTIVTAAVWPCGLCDQMIDGMGGPGDGEICEKCGEDLKAGRLRGTIKREPEKKNAGS
jgi:hypothetical protein